MQSYPGTNGNTFVISSTPGAGGVSGGVLTVVNDGTHGLYPKNVQVFAGDALQSGNLNAAPSGNKDAIAWLMWRMPDWINGGDYHTLYTGTVTMGITLVIAGAGAIIIGGAGGTSLLKIGDGVNPANLEISSTASLIQDSGGQAGWSGTSNYQSGSVTHVKSGSSWFFDSGMTSLQCNSSLTMQAPLGHVGATAVTQLRDVAATSLVVTAGGSGGFFVNDAANTFDPSQADMIEFDASGITADRTWTLSAPASGLAVTVLFYPVNVTSNAAHNVHIVDSGGGADIGTLSLGNPQHGVRVYYSVRLGRWIGTASSWAA